MQDRRKRGGHLVSKHRFIAAQFEAYLAGDLWLRLARHANGMADRLGEGLAGAGSAPVWPVEANEVFAALPADTIARLTSAGARFYPWTTDSISNGAANSRDRQLVRLVTSFATTRDEVDRFIALVSAC
jgi:threonine aldolase